MHSRWDSGPLEVGSLKPMANPASSLEALAQAMQDTGPEASSDLQAHSLLLQGLLRDAQKLNIHTHLKYKGWHYCL